MDDFVMADRLYVLQGGEAVAPDRSEYSPGIGKNEPVTLSCNAYLIQRGASWILWDTGIKDSLFYKPGGEVIAHNIRGIVTRPLAVQLEEIALSPNEISVVILSHGHFDHVGNCDLFPNATWCLQESEHKAMFGPEYRRYGYEPSFYETLRSGKLELFSGDQDLFGDRSISIISTPGHTPGHCSLLVRARKIGPVLLAGDVAHYRYNLDHRLVPKLNSDHQQSLRSMDRLIDIAKSEGAQILLNHDTRQNATIPHAPEELSFPGSWS